MFFNNILLDTLIFVYKLAFSAEKFVYPKKISYLCMFLQRLAHNEENDLHNRLAAMHSMAVQRMRAAGAAANGRRGG